MTDASRQHSSNCGDLKQSHCGAKNNPLAVIGIIFALVYPAGFTWLYFVALSETGSDARIAYLTGKSLQFVLPMVWLLLRLPAPARTGYQNWRWLALGMFFGGALLLLVLLGYGAWLRPDGLLQAASDNVRNKLAQFGIDSTAEYWLLAIGYCVLHSLLEEYYWRWFVFGSLLRLLGLWAAVAVSSVAFASHHVIVLTSYVSLPAALMASVAVALGGAFWAWLYARSGSLTAVWLSHLLVDAALFWLGWQMVFGA